MTTKKKPHVDSMGRAVTQAAGSDLCQPHNTPTRAPRQVLWADGKHTWSIDPDGVLRKTAKPEHQLRIPPAWCFDVAHIEAGKTAQVSKVEVFVPETNTTYRIPFATFVAHSFFLNRQHGPQWGCVLRYWTVTGPMLEAQPQAAPQAQSEPLQLALW